MKLRTNSVAEVTDLNVTALRRFFRNLFLSIRPNSGPAIRQISETKSSGPVGVCSVSESSAAMRARTSSHGSASLQRVPSGPVPVSATSSVVRMRPSTMNSAATVFA